MRQSADRSPGMETEKRNPQSAKRGEVLDFSVSPSRLAERPWHVRHVETQNALSKRKFRKSRVAASWCLSVFEG